MCAYSIIVVFQTTLTHYIVIFNLGLIGLAPHTALIPQALRGWVLDLGLYYLY